MIKRLLAGFQASRVIANHFVAGFPASRVQRVGRFSTTCTASKLDV